MRTSIIESNLTPPGDTIVTQQNSSFGTPNSTIKNERKSGILEPTMLLNGHDGEVLAVEFSPDGKFIASGSFDRRILIYNTYGDCDNWCLLSGHQNAILELHWSSDSSHIYSCSADSTLAVWDVEIGARIKKYSGHLALINSCQCTKKGPPLVVSGSDDGTTKIWDLRARKCVKTYESEYQILAVTIDNSSSRIFSGSLDNTINIYDMRSDTPIDSLVGHADSITGLDLSNDGSRLVSNGMDQSIRIWDIQPYFRGSNRCIKILSGSTHNFEKNLLRVRWNSDSTQCAAGSADRYAYIWCAKTARLLYRLPGHTGSVNEVVFHPTEPIVASASSDKSIYMGELS